MTLKFFIHFYFLLPNRALNISLKAKLMDPLILNTDIKTSTFSAGSESLTPVKCYSLTTLSSKCIYLYKKHTLVSV